MSQTHWKGSLDIIGNTNYSWDNLFDNTMLNIRPKVRKLNDHSIIDIDTVKDYNEGIRILGGDYIE